MVAIVGRCHASQREHPTPIGLFSAFTRNSRKCYDRVTSIGGSMTDLRLVLVCACLAIFAAVPERAAAQALGFSIAAHCDPDVLLVDEVLAVGDEAFSRPRYGRCWPHSARSPTVAVRPTPAVLEVLRGRLPRTRRPGGAGPCPSLVCG